MSFERQLRDLIRKELKLALEPIRQALRTASTAAAEATRSSERKKTSARQPTGAQRGCAVIACERFAISKGYCSAHYQKFRMLSHTGRLPRSWKAHAPPQSVENIDLPRGRAGAKLLAAARAKPKRKAATAARLTEESRP